MSRRDVYDPDTDEWQRIAGFEDYYVSSSGRVRGPGRYGGPHILQPTTGKNGHQYVSLYKNGVRTKKYVHRLVAENFLPNPEGHVIVRHLNDCPSDNNVENLAWGDQTDNMQDAIGIGTFYHLTDDDREKAIRIRCTPVRAKNLCTNDEIVFESQQEASRRLGVNQSCISNVIRGKRRQTSGWIFSTEE